MLTTYILLTNGSPQIVQHIEGATDDGGVDSESKPGRDEHAYLVLNLVIVEDPGETIL